MLPQNISVLPPKNHVAPDSFRKYFLNIMSFEPPGLSVR